jgi:hypothetical protein
MRNIRSQFELPQKWFTKPASFPGLRRSFDGEEEPETRKFKADRTREIAYEVAEETLDKFVKKIKFFFQKLNFFLYREGKNGRECLLRAICEVAETPVNHNGLVGELLQIFFTPGEHEKLHEDYHHARKAGFNGVSCEKLYADCPFGHGILDSVSLIKEFKFNNLLIF